MCETRPPPLKSRLFTDALYMHVRERERGREREMQMKEWEREREEKESEGGGGRGGGEREREREREERERRERETGCRFACRWAGGMCVLGGLECTCATFREPLLVSAIVVL
jgi:hypothetical protein